MNHHRNTENRGVVTPILLEILKTRGFLLLFDTEKDARFRGKTSGDKIKGSRRRRFDRIGRDAVFELAAPINHVDRPHDAVGLAERRHPLECDLISTWRIIKVTQRDL